jgi:hypothetical protein
MYYTTTDPRTLPYGTDIRCSSTSGCHAMVCGPDEQVARHRARSDRWAIAKDGTWAYCPSHRTEAPR